MTPTQSNLILDLSDKERADLFKQVEKIIETYRNEVHQLPVQNELTADAASRLLGSFSFDTPVSASEALDFVSHGLSHHRVHSSHPMYFGLFNPAPTTMGILADTLVAAFNPQLATWNHSSFAIAIEQHLIQQFGLRFGYELDAVDGTFTSGGAEANHTALLTALVSRFPDFDRKGVRGIDGQPVFYVSAESHHSFKKAARACGLGTDAIVEVPTTAEFKLDTHALVSKIRQDRQSGLRPFMVVATAGTTNAGIIDPILEIAKIAQSNDLWFHVDAAWGGAAKLVPELSDSLNGISEADSITFDAHKWLSVPMGAGMFITKHKEILGKTFHISTSYMPPRRGNLGEVDPYTRSLQWSRRFIGLKLYLSLAVAGWKGYAEVIRHQTLMGNFLRNRLIENDWKIWNETPLPVLCFTNRRSAAGNSKAYLEAIIEHAIASGNAWISLTQLGNQSVIRACITNFRTSEQDIIALVDALNNAREEA